MTKVPAETFPLEPITVHALSTSSAQNYSVISSIFSVPSETCGHKNQYKRRRGTPTFILCTYGKNGGGYRVWI